jgi:hypothetical protein
MRAWLRCYVTKHPCHGFRRAWAALRYDERREVNKKQVHRLWRDEGLQVEVVSPRRRVGVSSIPPIGADAANVVWAIDFQFDSTVEMADQTQDTALIDVHAHFLTYHYVRAAQAAGMTQPDGMPMWPSWTVDDRQDQRLANPAAMPTKRPSHQPQPPHRRRTPEPQDPWTITGQLLGADELERWVVVSSDDVVDGPARRWFSSRAKP